MGVVPNFSEGRRREVIDEIVAALRVPGVALVNVQWDPDHNRLDTTLLGSPAAVRASALAGAAAAVRLIDMREHRGSHPRMGAVDVIPFMPVRDVTMEECVELARDVGRELAEALGVPVYLYDRAALLPERASLAEVRKGEYEGLRDAVAAGERLPDFGPHQIGRAGAVAVGARKPLVAFNVYLDGRDEAAAREIAKAVRESSGGLPAVRAIGFDVPERASVTVSMNLVDYEVTSPRRAFDEVAEEASRRGMRVVSSEIVGLVPAAALGAGDVEHLRLEGFDANEQILENLVSLVDEAGGDEGGHGFGGNTVEGFLDRLASEDATPGGGSAAAVAASTGAALVAMVARLTDGKKGYEDVSPRMADIVKTADAERTALLTLADRDTAAFDGVMRAFRMPKESDAEKAERTSAIQTAFREAAAVPADVARRSADLLPLAVEVIRTGNENAASDGLAAAHLLFAGVQTALANVAINLGSIKDEELVARHREESAKVDAESRSLLETADREFHRRLEAG
jgi:glutamate formiminotransferase/formiminotetrahydrofolate cyclodeaminase